MRNPRHVGYITAAQDWVKVLLHQVSCESSSVPFVHMPCLFQTLNAFAAKAFYRRMYRTCHLLRREDRTNHPRRALLQTRQDIYRTGLPRSGRGQLSLLGSACSLSRQPTTSARLYTVRKCCWWFALLLRYSYQPDSLCIASLEHYRGQTYPLHIFCIQTRFHIRQVHTVDTRRIPLGRTYLVRT